MTSTLNVSKIEPLSGSGTIHVGSDASNTISVNTTTQAVTMSGAVTIGGNTHPSSNNAFDLGTANNCWRNIYTGDLMLSNLGRDSGNDVDGSRGSWVLQEGDSSLFVINKVTGKKFRLAMEEID
jgi:hypothetical protein